MDQKPTMRRTDLIGRNPEASKWELAREREHTPADRARTLFDLIETMRVMRNKTRDLRP